MSNCDEDGCICIKCMLRRVSLTPTVVQRMVSKGILRSMNRFSLLSNNDDNCDVIQCPLESQQDDNFDGKIEGNLPISSDKCRSAIVYVKNIIALISKPIDGLQLRMRFL